MTQGDAATPVPALRVRQWLAQWDELTYDPKQNQARPKEHFYLFSLPASQLRALAGIYRRSTDEGVPRKDDLGIQRKHDPERSEEIRRYVEGGYPWSGLSEAKRQKPESDSLKKPGWLPTAVVVNILNVNDQRSGRRLTSSEVIKVEDDQLTNSALLHLPKLVDNENQMPPIEVIDGQHRLFAFEDDDKDGDEYYLPVVAFHGLDISWQAYLFWTINIKPKKINPSLAFDLYPLLREQSWLDSGEVVQVYRESRAQELTEILWASPDSPWYRRINMLGGTRKDNGPVTQAAFIRSLTSSMIKSWRPTKGPAGGIFGGTPDAGDGLAWSRLQQGAFLLTAWRLLAEKTSSAKEPWAEHLREQAGQLDVDGHTPNRFTDPAFAGTNSLLATDQGVRGFQSVINDLCYIRHRELQLSSWRDLTDFSDVSPENVSLAAKSLENEPVFEFLGQICESLTSFDWRSSSALGLTEQERLVKAVLRGSGGYRELRNQLAFHLRNSPHAAVASAAHYLES
ncbi:DGQHR domain-containing protein [Paenarthrobacter sp. PH39-S1]|uniref:DGQHR domain-containing protein n=1 Tax=Paenarthrobacter sp. PH39-S1 TaxID=3046204 RepID=UPI0024BAB87D|nr:DGQHR domain-containing protein [Paenarthrobacter sp. PH39-S1]MDJ0357679.1 DGQHR domain-containing protein [Paenarthrobacter sp. PH39-S1]